MEDVHSSIDGAVQATQSFAKNLGPEVQTPMTPFKKEVSLLSLSCMWLELLNHLSEKLSTH